MATVNKHQHSWQKTISEACVCIFCVSAVSVCPQRWYSLYMCNQSYLPEATAGDHEVGLCGPEDVVYGSGSQHLPHGLIDDLLIVATAHRHRPQEAHGEHLLQEGVCGSIHKHVRSIKEIQKH